MMQIREKMLCVIFTLSYYVRRVELFRRKQFNCCDLAPLQGCRCWASVVTRSFLTDDQVIAVSYLHDGSRSNIEI